MQGFLQYIAALEESYINFGDYNLENKFHHYNTVLFDNHVPACPVVWTENLKNGSRSAAGLTTFNHIGRNLVPGSLKIQISTRFKRSEQDLDATLVHEMIHAFLVVQGFPEENHGFRFLAQAHRVEQMLGLKIPVTDDLSALELTNDAFTTTTVLLKTYRQSWDAIFYSGTMFDDPRKQDELKAFWGVPGRLSAHEEIRVIKIQSNLLMKYGGARTVKQTKWHIISPTEIADIMQRGQIMFTITPGSVSHEFAAANLPTKEALVVTRTNTRTHEIAVAFYLPGIARDTLKMQILKEKWHSWYAAGYDVDIFLTTTTALNRGFVMQRDPSKGSYYIMRPNNLGTVDELRRNANYLERWHQ
jgi:hypothetical protein